MRQLPIATRAWTQPATTPKAPKSGRSGSSATRSRQPVGLPVHALVIDTETTLDETQRFLFGVYRFLRRRPASPLVRAGWDCLGEGLIFADDVPTRDPEGYETLREFARTRLADVALNTTTAGEPDWRLGLVSRTEFAERWWHRVGVPHDSRRDPAVLVFSTPPLTSRV